MSQLVKTELTVPGTLGETQKDALGEEICGWLAANSLQGWEELAAPATGDITFRLYLEPQSPLAEIFKGYAETRWPMVRVSMESMEQQDWAAAWKEFFTPIAIGERFEIVPPWLSSADHHGLTPIIIEPKMAFGTGHHATTALCLEAIASLVANGRLTPESAFLDLGTGSGILAIGLAFLGLRGMALDIDPQAILCAAENLALNNLPAPDAPNTPVRLAVGSLDALTPTQTFDVLVANILAQPLIQMAPLIIRHLKPGAALILSGLLTTQAPDVAQAYTRLGLPDPIRKDSGEWSALLWM